MLDIKKISPTLKLLLITTERLVREKGCQQTTMQDIIQESGVSKGGIYHYIESKDELLAFVLQVLVAQKHHRFLRQLEHTEQSLVGGIRLLMDYIYQPSTDVSHQILTYLLAKKDNLSVRQTIRSYYRQMIHTTCRWIEQGQLDGRFDDRIETKKIADLFVLIALGLHVRDVIPSETGFFSNEDFIRFMRGILEK